MRNCERDEDDEDDDELDEEFDEDDEDEEDDPDEEREAEDGDMDEDEEDDEDLEDEEFDSGAEEDEGEDTSGKLTVEDGDPALVAHLTALLDEDATASALVAWLKEKGDSRARLVRELAEATFRLPRGHHTGEFITLARGRWWEIRLFARGVGLWLPTGLTPLGTFWGWGLTDEDGRNEFRIRRARRARPDQLRRGFEFCRKQLITGLFGTTVERLTVCRDLREARDKKSTLALLRRERFMAVDAVCELHDDTPERFREVMDCIWAQPCLHNVGYAILDGVEPGWQQQLQALLFGGGQVSARPSDDDHRRAEDACGYGTP